MIGKLKGLVDYIDKDNIIIEVGGVGYLVYCSNKIIQSISEIGQDINLIIETHVREDHINLYGFASYSERDWFRALLTAKGVGTRVALAILSVLSPREIALALVSKDKLAFTQISGIGPKLAERIIIELKDKIISLADAESLPSKLNSKNIDIVSDALSALTNLGYSKADAYDLLSKLYAENNNITVGELIKMGLKGLAK